MSIARVVYTQTVAGNKNFAVPFPYISRDHVAARVNGAEVNYTWNSTNIVTLNEAPPVGAEIELRRSSSINDKLVVFTDGSTITETDLNLLATQTFFLAQEADDLAQESNALARDATATANSATSTANSAVTTANTASSVASQADSKASSALAAANSAVTTANSASTKADNAVTTAGNAQAASAAAQQASTNAVASANAAVATADSAKATAAGAVAKADTAIATANSASTTAQAASTSASTAVGVAGVAANLAQTASDRATDAEAAASAASAAAQSAAADAAAAVATASGLETTVKQVLEDVQAIAGGDLSDFSKNSLNLSDLTDKATARANLGLGNVDNTSDADKPISAATQSALNGKANTSHTHAVADVTGLQSALDGKAAASHGHAISAVTGLQTALDGKAASSHSHAIANVTGLQAALDGTVKTTGDQGISGKKTFDNSIFLQGGSPTLFLKNTTHLSSMVHVAGNNFYVLRGEINADTWTMVNGQWPLTINLTNNDATFGGNVTATANITAYSDIRLKTDLTKIADALGKVCALNGYTYTRKDTGERQTGVVAQEVQKVLPEAVMDNGDRLSVAYGNMVGLLIEAIKELKAEVDQLKGK